LIGKKAIRLNNIVTDLVHLAKLYDLCEARLPHDPENFLDTDAAEAIQKIS
jgi:hypothetical protein